ncbi:Tigger transposable element-derived protein 6 [Trichinella zimbabwensis]|uniref:Tigger transposable element-derived protein 6 n=1 Tax=Trichinella zimbabwensis TaxID=268475 RepID=A0A0V1HZB6_9BILA|nr:Tigger transposable element-derived protein 6 [Trichinella zimbabwensis]
MKSATLLPLLILGKGKYSSRRKLVRFARADDVDKAIFEWFQAARSNSIPINGLLTEEKALAMAKLLGPTELHASIICGEERSVPFASANQWGAEKMKGLIMKKTYPMPMNMDF